MENKTVYRLCWFWEFDETTLMPGIFQYWGMNSRPLPTHDVTQKVIYAVANWDWKNEIDTPYMTSDECAAYVMAPQRTIPIIEK